MADSAWLGTAKPIIAMVHFPPLPGSPRYDPAGGMAAIIDSAARDIEALQDGRRRRRHVRQRGRPALRAEGRRPRRSPRWRPRSPR